VFFRDVFIKKLVKISLDLRVFSKEIKFEFIEFFKSFDLVDIALRFVFEILIIINNFLKL
jgi:hypothetical protein